MSDTKKPAGKGQEAAEPGKKPTEADPPKETGGPKGLEPTRYGDWEKAGRCSDF